MDKIKEAAAEFDNANRIKSASAAGMKTREQITQYEQDRIKQILAAQDKVFGEIDTLLGALQKNSNALSSDKRDEWEAYLYLGARTRGPIGQRYALRQALYKYDKNKVAAEQEPVSECVTPFIDVIQGQDLSPRLIKDVRQHLPEVVEIIRQWWEEDKKIEERSLSPSNVMRISFEGPDRYGLTVADLLYVADDETGNAKKLAEQIVLDHKALIDLHRDAIAAGKYDKTHDAQSPFEPEQADSYRTRTIEFVQRLLKSDELKKTLGPLP